MENKINIAELLKDCPSGMELDCNLFEGLEFDSIVDNEFLPISCRVKNPNGYNGYNFTKYGCWLDATFAKCVIFPKGKTTWEGFVPPCKFKDGDVVVTTLGNIAIISNKINNKINNKIYITYCGLFGNDIFTVDKYNVCPERHATEEEKQKLFDAIKANGYKWNAETKTLEKLVEPRFKVGNAIQNEDGYKVKITEVNIEDECYGYESMIAKGIGGIAFSEQDNWELIPNKFDITTLKPFDKVLVRVCDTAKWIGDFYMWYDDTEKDFPYNCVGGIWSQCIPYESNEHLLGTIDDCDEFFLTWE